MKNLVNGYVAIVLLIVAGTIIWWPSQLDRSDVRESELTNSTRRAAGDSKSTLARNQSTATVQSLQRKPSGELIDDFESEHLQMLESGIAPNGEPFKPEILKRMRQRHNAQVAREIEWEAEGAALEARIQASLTPAQKEIRSEQSALHDARQEIAGAVRDKTSARWMAYAKEHGEESTPDSMATTDQRQLLDALKRDRLEDPVAAARIREYLRTEKDARTVELSQKTALDPNWAESNLNWINDVTTRLHIDLDAPDWMNDYTAYMQSLGDRHREAFSPPRHPELYAQGVELFGEEAMADFKE